MKNEKWTCFPFFYENEKRMRTLRIQSKNVLNMKMVVNLFEFHFSIYQKHEMALSVHGLRKCEFILENSWKSKTSVSKWEP